ncbi:MAG: hypothetical protein NTV63_00820, partial [Candidatus Woesearchaeota archaeon]|nr:hypothetical protein [Candidatus Woesearchaeota archaeon]
MENELEKVVESAKEAESIGQKTAITPESLTYETELVKGYISEREKGGLFEGVETSKKTYNTVIAPAINNVKSYTDKIKQNSRKLTETFEGESSLWQKIVRAWYQISKKSQKEKELLIDTVIRNVERSVGNVDYQIESLRQRKTETEQYCSQQGELKVDLNDRIDECNDLISKVEFEIEKYRRDGKKLEDSGEYKLRDRLSEELKKLEKDKNTLGLERRLASDEY